MEELLLSAVRTLVRDLGFICRSRVVERDRTCVGRRRVKTTFPYRRPWLVVSGWLAGWQFLCAVVSDGKRLS